MICGAAGYSPGVLELNVRKQFPSGGEVSAGLTLPDGVTCLFGPSGSGKTTVLRMIAGLTAPTSGRVVFRGQDWTRLPVQKRGVAFVFQDYALFPHLTVAQNVGFGAPGQNVGPWLERFGIGALGGRYPREISAGQGQRVALARALMTQPRLLLLDEPLSALDAATRLAARKELADILRQTGTPAILVTHDPVEATTLAGHVVVMSGGRVLQSGGLREVFNSPVSAEVAQIVGVETILSGEVVDSSEGLVRVRTAGVEWIAVSNLPTGRRVRVFLRAEDVAVLARGDSDTLEERDSASQRNRLVGRVVGVYSEGALTRVQLDCAGVGLAALITTSSADQLRLSVGSSVRAVVKATAVKVVE